MNNRIGEFERKLHYTFRDRSLLTTALTHSSYDNPYTDRARPDNERLEFLGDAVLDAVISETLYRSKPPLTEGMMTKLHAKIVCESSLGACGNMLEIGEYLKLGKGEERNGGRHRISIIADAVEAVIGAVFLDSDYETARDFVLFILGQTIEDALCGRLKRDYKSEIQERVQCVGAGHEILRYVVTGEEGPDHAKTFYVDLYLGERVIGSGAGQSKKAAEQDAARSALERSDGNVF